MRGLIWGVHVEMSVRMTDAEFIRADKTVISQSAVENASGTTPTSPDKPAPKRKKTSYPGITQGTGAAPRGHGSYVC